MLSVTRRHAFFCPFSPLLSSPPTPPTPTTTTRPHAGRHPRRVLRLLPPLHLRVAPGPPGPVRRLPPGPRPLAGEIDPGPRDRLREGRHGEEGRVGHTQAAPGGVAGGGERGVRGIGPVLLLPPGTNSTLPVVSPRQRRKSDFANVPLSSPHAHTHTHAHAHARSSSPRVCSTGSSVCRLMGVSTG